MTCYFDILPWPLQIFATFEPYLLYMFGIMTKLSFI